MRELLIKAELAFTVIVLILYSGGPLTVLISGGASEGDKENITPDFALIRLIFFLSYVVTAALLLPNWRRAAYLLVKEKFILSLVFLSLVSVLWSFIPALTIQRGVGLIGTTLFGVYLATRYSLKQQVRILAWTLSIILFLSFIFAIALPKYGIMSGIHAGAWRGIYTHKNVLGKIMVLSTALFWMFITTSKKTQPWLWFNLGFSLLLLALSKSTSSLVGLVILISISLVSRPIRWSAKLAIPTICFLLSVITSVLLLTVSNLEAVLNLAGKDTTLTGRTNLWPAVVTMISKRPWLGYGFSGFWNGLSSEGSYVWKATNWTPPNSHNGILDLMLDLGFLGLAIFLISYVISLIKSILLMRSTDSIEGLWPLISITYLAVINFSESSLLIQNNIFWVLYVSVALSQYKNIMNLSIPKNAYHNTSP